ncbi:hypothetical protein O77CONTIG1_04469 [Leptolyngbya sp. O-77]|nr:hypothetical protein O77CONTIG1_04469 [Leptolyngbya sp. O-77]
MLCPFLFAGIENGNNLLSLWIDTSHKIVTPLVATTTCQRKIVECVGTPQRFWDDMINSKPISTQPFWRVTILADIVSTLSNSLSDFITDRHVE